jgi:hypothetical protein
MTRSKIALKENGKIYIEYPIKTIKKISVGLISSAIYAELGNGRVFKMIFEKGFGIELKKCIGDQVGIN